ncbi:coiled-coil domain-containing protein [Diaporthe helianthi]|uniref:Coiled-coil domain-containing protein n=1 Tax=Diaporthe helianthi TaxID=158607 RepID=A0A2P5IFS3_DIAHE|nr:coiled-coil domain-containing protein [Diaporthe helianthi]
MTPPADTNSPPPPTAAAASADLFSRPRPRPPRSSSQAAKIRVQNRRRQYLENNPSYLSSADNQLADQELYDTLIRRFQTPAERESEIRRRGWGKVLETSLMRGEDRLDRVASSLSGDSPAPGPGPGPRGTNQPASSCSSRGPLPSTAGGSQASFAASTTAAAFFTIDADLAESGPETKEEGRAAWEDFLRERFIRGGDDDFDYGPVDGDDSLDELESRDREEEWFDGEDPEWASDGSEGSPGPDGGPSKRRGPRERVLTGQTGVQDY